MWKLAIFALYNNQVTFESRKSSMFGFNNSFGDPALHYYYSLINLYNQPVFPSYFNQQFSIDGNRMSEIKLEEPQVKKQENILLSNPKNRQQSNLISELKQGFNYHRHKQQKQEWYQEQLKQVKSRNILPNVINLLVSYIRRRNKSGKIVKKIIDKFGDSRYDVKKFYSYQLYLKEAITDYNTRNILHLIITFCDPTSSVFRVEEQMFYNMVCRTLIASYLKTEGPLSLLTSKKEHKTNKRDHFKIYRYVLNDLRHYYQRQKTGH